MAAKKKTTKAAAKKKRTTATAKKVSAPKKKKKAATTKRATATKRTAEPPRPFRDALVALPMPEVVQTDDPPYRVFGQGFLPLWGGDEWLFGYDPKKARSFDRARWFVVGIDGDTDVYLYDLKTGKVAALDTELGYADAHCEPIADDWLAFVKGITPRETPEASPRAPVSPRTSRPARSGKAPSRSRRS